MALGQGAGLLGAGPRVRRAYIVKHYKDRRKESAVCSHRVAAHAGNQRHCTPSQIESPNTTPAPRRSSNSRGARGLWRDTSSPLLPDCLPCAPI